MTMLRRYIIAAASAGLVACHMILGVGDLEGPATARDAGEDDFDWDFDAAIPPRDASGDFFDATTDAPPARRRVFVTSATVGANFGGVDAGHNKCQELATAAGLGGQWIAWLSGNGGKAGAELTFDGPYELVNGTLISATKAGLFSGLLAAPINAVEDGGLANGGHVWTGTRKDGEPGATCDNWTSKGGIGKVGTGGSYDQKDGRWTDNGGAVGAIPAGWPCGNSGRLYCFER